MKLTAPYSGVAVEADGELAERLIAQGFKPAAKKQAPRKTKAKE